jgi:Family of unknown function (DUF5343)
MADAARDENGRGTMPPYVPFPSFKNLIQNTKQQGLATRIDRSVLTNFLGSTQTQLITTLRFLGLTDAKGHPTERMVALVDASGTEEWPKTLSALLREIYPTLFDIDLARASPNQFNERFRSAFPGAESVQRKAVTFFIGAAQDAKIPINALITKNKKPRAASPTSGKRRVVKPRAALSQVPPSEEPGGTRLNGAHDGSIPRAPNAYELLAVFDPNDMTATEQAAIWTLIQYLKRKEVAVVASKQRRERSTKTRPVAADAEAKEAEDEATTLAD